jgi:PPOX class probable F420-dependent enzyme
MGLELDQALGFVREHRHGVLATLRGDGTPQLSNILYLVGDDDAVRISVTNSRAKTGNLRRDPRASLHVTREDFYAYVVLDGTVALTPVAADPHDATVDQLVDMYRSVRGEHPDWDEFRDVMVSEGRIIATLSVRHAYGMLGS